MICLHSLSASLVKTTLLSMQWWSSSLEEREFINHCALMTCVHIFCLSLLCFIGMSCCILFFCYVRIISFMSGRNQKKATAFGKACNWQSLISMFGIYSWCKACTVLQTWIKTTWSLTKAAESAVFIIYLEKVLTQISSDTSHRLTRASALPVAKYCPVGSNSIHMQLAGWALRTACNLRSG